MGEIMTKDELRRYVIRGSAIRETDQWVAVISGVGKGERFLEDLSDFTVDYKPVRVPCEKISPPPDTERYPHK